MVMLVSEGIAPKIQGTWDSGDLLHTKLIQALGSGVIGIILPDASWSL